ncbi:MAG TPA: aminopeptidase [Ignavibacteria bacterium]|nr:aminopeptidase [Ignavibacteria bacterium]
MIKTELFNSSIIALKDYLGIKKDETLLIISDETKRDIAQTLLEAGKQLCKEAFLIEMKQREINGEEPPEQISELMKKVDVVLCPTAKSLTHTDARRNAVKEGVRVATMPGIGIDTMVRCLSADAEKVIDLSLKVKGILNDASEVRVVTEKGTDLYMPMKGRNVIESTGVLRNKGESGNLPSGEVYLAPLENLSHGKLVIDGSVAGIGMLEAPITIEVKDGFAEKIEGGNEAKILAGMLDKVGRDARAVAEFGVGTNYKAQLCGEILEDEKVYGTIHVAFGNNVSMGGSINVKSHIDGLVIEPDVYVDGKLVMQKGRLL